MWGIVSLAAVLVGTTGPSLPILCRAGWGGLFTVSSVLLSESHVRRHYGFVPHQTFPVTVLLNLSSNELVNIKQPDLGKGSEQPCF